MPKRSMDDTVMRHPSRLQIKSMCERLLKSYEADRKSALKMKDLESYVRLGGMISGLRGVVNYCDACGTSMLGDEVKS